MGEEVSEERERLRGEQGDGEERDEERLEGGDGLEGGRRGR